MPSNTCPTCGLPTGGGHDCVRELRALVRELAKFAAATEYSALVAYGSVRRFIDHNVPGWVRGDDGPVYPVMRIADGCKKVLARPDVRAIVEAGNG